MMKRIFAVYFILLAFLQPQTVHGYTDSTDFNPVPVSVKALSGGIPVGTLIALPSSVNPPDMENWLECNGQSTSGYPELAVMYGATVPDCRGLFLRGHGGSSDAIGVTQGDTAYFSEGTSLKLGGAFRWVGTTNYNTEGAPFEYVFSLGYSSSRVFGSDDSKRYTNMQTQDIAVEISNDATETRPRNMAVRYLIRARP
jgi:hypothetical protein